MSCIPEAFVHIGAQSRKHASLSREMFGLMA